MIADSKPSPGSVCPRLKVPLFFGGAALLAAACAVMIRATAVQASPPEVRRLPSDATPVVSVTGVVQPASGGIVLKSANGRYAFEGRDLSRCAGQKVVVSGTVKTSHAEKGPRRILSVSRVEPVEEKKIEPGHTSP